MATRRATFRIEDMLRERAPAESACIGTAGPAPDPAGTRDLAEEIHRLRLVIEHQHQHPQAPAAARPDLDSLRGEIGLMHQAIARTKSELAAIHVDGVETPPMARLADELAAVVAGTERATQAILDAAEIVEDAARTLSALASTAQQQDLARDILDPITRIFEACNFQDLAGQRISKVTATLKFVEEHLGTMMQIWGGAASFRDIVPTASGLPSHDALLNGPRLDGDDGHASQDDIDALFN